MNTYQTRLLKDPMITLLTKTLKVNRLPSKSKAQVKTKWHHSLVRISSLLKSNKTNNQGLNPARTKRGSHHLNKNKS